MKPFNLQEALSNQEKFGDPKVVTRDGRKALQIAHFTKSNNRFPVLVLVDEEYGPETYTISGEYTDRADDLDLFMAPTKVTKWVNILRDEYGDVFTATILHDDQKQASAIATEYKVYKIVATVPISWEE